MQVTNEELERIRKIGAPLIQLKAHSKEPVRPWKNEHWTPKDSDLAYANVGIRCGEQIEGGGYLGILDIDPKNGGLETLEMLKAKYDFDPDSTFKVRTGSGGFHLYFRMKEPYRKKIVGKGIDFQAAGSYCVAPPSIHDNGNPYYIDADEEIADLPEWLKGETMRSDLFNFNSDQQPLRDIEQVGEGGRHHYIVRFGYYLRKIGMVEDEILLALKARNEKVCNPPLPEKEIEGIASRMMRYQPEEQLDEPVTKEEIKKHVEVEAETVQVSPQIESLDARFAVCYGKADGMVKEIAKTIIEHSDRDYKQFALASALSLIGTCAQGSFTIANLHNDKPSGSGTSLYHWLIAPAAAGKEAYRSAVYKYLGAVDKRLILDRIGSQHGLRSALFCFNSLCMVADEFQDELEKFAGRNAQSYLAQVVNDFKQLANDLEKLPSVVLSSKKYPAIDNPRFTVFGVGTVGGYVKHLQKDLIGGGLLSRFIVWPVMKVPNRNFNERLSELPEDQIKFLKTLVDMGLTAYGEESDFDEDLNNYWSISAGGFKKKEDYKPIVHKAHCDPMANIIYWRPSAREKMKAYYRTKEKIYKKMTMKNLAGSDISPASIHDRAARVATRLSAIHALGRTSETIEDVDVDFGISLADVTCDAQVSLLDANAGESDFDRLCSKIYHHIKAAGGKATKTEIYRRDGRNTRASVMNEVLLTLCAAGRIFVLDRISGRPLRVYEKLPKGHLTFINEEYILRNELNE